MVYDRPPTGTCCSRRPRTTGKVVKRHGALVAVPQVLQRRRAGLQLTGTEDHGNRDSLAVGQLELVANAAVWLEGEVDPQSLLAQ